MSCCAVCNRIESGHRPLCASCVAFVRRRAERFDEAMPVLWRTVDDGSLQNHRRDLEMLKECGE